MFHVKHRSRPAPPPTLCRRPNAPQIGIVEGLHAERHAVDADAAVVAEARRLHARRVGLERDLGAGLEPPEAGDLVQDGSRPSSADISEGVPPPKKMLPTLLPGTSSAQWRSSRR